MADPETDEKKREESLSSVLSGLGETSTLHGVPKIVTSRQIVVRVLWCIVLLGACAVFSLQMYELCKEYYSYPTTTNVRLQFAPLALPGVTVCNMNPIKSTALKYFHELFFMDNVVNFKEWYKDPSFQGFISRDTGKLVDDLRELFNETNDQFIAFKTRFLIEVQRLSKDYRMAFGHQLKDFILAASFAGHNLPTRSFSTSLSHEYGNCFTLDAADIIVRGSGQEHSLVLLFNVEKMFYVENFSSTYGVRLVLHEHGTYPLPASEGITLSTNYETHIGVRMKKIRRLGGKYGECSDGYEFREKYGYNYSVQLCYSFCEVEHVVSECKCHPLSSLKLLNTSAPLCDFDDDRECLNGVNDRIFKGKIYCGCKSQCEEKVFTTTLSGRKWPHTTYLSEVLILESCKRNVSLPTNTCEIFESGADSVSAEQIEDMNENFLAAYIYFEDLNFEEITEEAMYNPVRFLSDIGGAMGLYIGASFLTIFEVFQLLLEMILYYRRRCTRSEPVRNKYTNNMPV